MLVVKALIRIFTDDGEYTREIDDLKSALTDYEHIEAMYLRVIRKELFIRILDSYKKD